MLDYKFSLESDQSIRSISPIWTGAVPARGSRKARSRQYRQTLRRNLSAPSSMLLTDDEIWKLRVLIHVHDTFKAGGQVRSADQRPAKHASLALTFWRPLKKSRHVPWSRFHDVLMKCRLQYEHHTASMKRRLTALCDLPSGLEFLPGPDQSMAAPKERVATRCLVLGQMEGRVAPRFSVEDIL